MTAMTADLMAVSVELRERQWANGWPWCDTCRLPATGGALDGHDGPVHTTDAYPRGVPADLDASGHFVTLTEWRSQWLPGRRRQLRPPGAELPAQPKTDAKGRRLRHRRGRWTYVVDRFNGRRWRLDGTTLDLEYDELNGGGALRGAWVVWLGDRGYLAAVDHYLDGSMAYVEAEVFGGGRDRWAVAARDQLAMRST